MNKKHTAMDFINSPEFARRHKEIKESKNASRKEAMAKKMGNKDAVKEQRKKESRNAYIFS